VTGALAGARFGIAGIPIRWTSALQGRVPGHASKHWDLIELHSFAAQLDGRSGAPHVPERYGGIPPTEVFPRIWASDLEGAKESDTDFAVISMCRTGKRFPHAIQRFAYLVDDDSNSELDFVLRDILADMVALHADGQRVLVHCYGGHSRTGLVLRAWLRRSEGVSAAEATERVAAVWPQLGLWNESFSAALERISRG
jgi:ADP-ribosyl-[dinitrogen reductase] hydrolase